MNENEVKKFIVDGEVIAVPSVYQWARQPEKPEYTAQEVGALPDTTTVLQESDFKTINNESIVGAGNIETGSDYSEGQNIKIENDAISAKGYTYDDSNDSFAIGNSGAQAISNGSVAEGNQTVANGEYSHVEGDWTLGIQAEYDCELNDIGRGRYACFNCERYEIDPNIEEGTSSARLYKENTNSCYYKEHDRYYILSISIEIPSTYQQMLNFYNAKIIYDNNEYYIKSYMDLRYNASSTSESLTYEVHTQHGTENLYQYDIEMTGDTIGNTDFVILTQVELRKQNGDLIELRNVEHGKAKLVVFQSGVTGQASHAEGGTQYITSTGSHAEGMNNQIHGNFSHAEGAFNNIYGTYSHAEGYSNTVDGIASHASGSLNIVKGDGGHAFGEGLIAHAGQTVIGKYNVEDEANQYVFIIGNGTSSIHRHNAFAIDWNGNTRTW